MNQKRSGELQGDFLAAFQRLTEAVEEKTITGSLLYDATIKRFEFTFELGWKLLKTKLAFMGIEVNSPREAIKEAYKAKLIHEGDAWIKMLEDRNRTSHAYDEAKSKAIYLDIVGKYFGLLGNFVKSLK